MSQFAPVAPPELLHHMKRAGDFVLGNYHLILAHDVAERPWMYAGLFHEGCTVIMDNSVIELGKPVTREVMKIACATVRPKYIVLPDVIKDRKETLRMTLEAKDEWKEVKPVGCKWMAVPQGENLEELEDCAKNLHAGLDSNLGMWGVGRFVNELLGSRKDLLTILLTRFRLPSYSGCVHLLGFSSSMQDDYACCKIHGVAGIDSAVPVRMGQRNQLITLDQPDPGPRGDWWNEDHPDITAATIANLYLIRGWLQPTRIRSSDMATDAVSWMGKGSSTEATLESGPSGRVGARF